MCQVYEAEHQLMTWLERKDMKPKSKNVTRAIPVKLWGLEFNNKIMPCVWSSKRHAKYWAAPHARVIKVEVREVKQ